ncbi:MAG: amidohydrolase family protein [Candidatus Sericytochromatia bacterium]
MKTLDFHVHLGTSIFGYGQSLDQLIASLDRLSIDQAVVVPVQPLSYRLEPENESVAAAVLKYPNRLHGFCRIDPRQGEAARSELISCIKVLKLKGLFLHPWEESCPVNSTWVKALMPTVVDLGIPVMIAGGHVRVSMASQIADLARDFPNVPMVITSGGQINISGIALGEATQLLKEHSNLYLETSGIYREDFIEDMVPVIGSERMLFGSNSPEYCQELELLRPRLAHLDDRHKLNLLSDTAARLLKLTDAI